MVCKSPETCDPSSTSLAFENFCSFNLTLTSAVPISYCHVYFFRPDPKDSNLDFRSLLKHKDYKKRGSGEDDPDWGKLKHGM
mgnify:CR=1 FL=1